MLIKIVLQNKNFPTPFPLKLCLTFVMKRKLFFTLINRDYDGIFATAALAKKDFV